ncbi:MAG TPA: hypothetical protein VIH61_08580 [Waddliaceae bacterium]
MDDGYSHLHSHTKNHIYAIMNNEQFQKDPKSYLHVWGRLNDCHDQNRYIKWRKQSNHPLLDTTLSKKEKSLVESEALLFVAPYASLSTCPPDLRETERKRRRGVFDG